MEQEGKEGSVMNDIIITLINKLIRVAATSRGMLIVRLCHGADQRYASLRLDRTVIHITCA
jgi:hypothetical protein